MKRLYAYTFNSPSDSAPEISAYRTISVPVILVRKNGSFDTWRLDAGLISVILSANRFNLPGDLSMYFLSQRNILGDFSVIGAELKLTPALRFKNGYLGIPLKISLPVATHIRHSDLVSDTFDQIIGEDGNPIEAEPVDGWYATTGLSIRAGIGGSFAVEEKMTINSEFGFIWYPPRFTGIFDSMMIGQIPFYLDLGCSLEM